LFVFTGYRSDPGEIQHGVCVPLPDRNCFATVGFPGGLPRSAGKEGELTGIVTGIGRFHRMNNEQGVTDSVLENCLKKTSLERRGYQICPDKAVGGPPNNKKYPQKDEGRGRYSKCSSFSLSGKQTLMNIQSCWVWGGVS